MKEMIFKQGGQRTSHVYRNLRVDHSGFLKIVSFEASGSDYRQEMLVRRDAVVVLPIDWRKREVYLVEQPRHVLAFSENEEGSSLLEKALQGGTTADDQLELQREQVAALEIPAGIIDPGEFPEQTVVRELEEETGLIINASMLEKVASYYPSIGGTKEKITVYFAALPDPISRAETLSDEDIDRVTVWKLGFDDVFERLRKDQVITASSNVLFRELFIRDKKLT